MACEIQNPAWIPIEFEKAELLVGPIEFHLRVFSSTGEGPLDLPLIGPDGGAPLAVFVSPETPGTLNYTYSEFDPSCDNLVVTDLKPLDVSGGFNFRADGTGIGISDLRNDGLKVVYVNLSGFPVVFDQPGDSVQMKYVDNTQHYYISPQLSSR